LLLAHPFDANGHADVISNAAEPIAHAEFAAFYIEGRFETGAYLTVPILTGTHALEPDL